jgi:o-succinylbenzoate synthase
MRIVEVSARTLSIPLREPIVTSRGRWERRRVGLLSLRTDSGLVGLGEYVAPEPDDLGEDASVRLEAALDGLDLGDPVLVERVLRSVDRWPFVGRMARTAAESAIVDLRARAGGDSVAASLGPGAKAAVAVNGLIGILAPEDAATAAAALVGQGYRCLKLKAGAEAATTVAGRVGAVREAVGQEVALRVDFNGSLDRATAAQQLAALEPFDLEYAEQPLAVQAGARSLAELRAATNVPLAADESVRDLGSARALLAAEAIDGLVLKPARVGGLRQADAILRAAMAAGVPVTLSTLFETGVGLAGALQLAALAPGSQAHGLATADLLESDLLAEPLRIRGGRMALPAGPGLGIELDAAAVERYAVA